LFLKPFLLLFRLRQRHRHDVLSNEPHLKLVASNHITNEQVVRSIVAGIRGSTRHRSRFLQHDFMGAEETRNLDRYLLAAFGGIPGCTARLSSGEFASDHS
jgi:hypothetical protein